MSKCKKKRIEFTAIVHSSPNRFAFKLSRFLVSGNTHSRAITLRGLPLSRAEAVFAAEEPEANERQYDQSHRPGFGYCRF